MWIATILVLAFRSVVGELTNSGIIHRYLIEAADRLGQIDSYVHLGGEFPSNAAQLLHTIEANLQAVRELSNSAAQSELIPRGTGVG